MSHSFRIAVLIFSAIGWLAALILHVAGWYHIDTGMDMTATMLLQFGAIAAVFPVLLEIKRNPFNSPLMRETPSGLAFVKMLFSGVPAIVTVLFVIGFVYTGLIFFLTEDFYWHGVPELRDGQFVQNNHGAIAPVTEWEYHFYRSQHVRKISGHWMFFYSLAMVGAFPRKQTTSKPK